jgi:hypothetical protein
VATWLVSRGAFAPGRRRASRWGGHAYDEPDVNRSQQAQDQEERTELAVELERTAGAIEEPAPSPPSAPHRLDTKTGRRAAVNACRAACAAVEGRFPPANWVWKAAGYSDRRAYHDWINIGKNSARFRFVLDLPAKEVIKRVRACRFSKRRDPS